jgi:hypothetical protein
LTGDATGFFATAGLLDAMGFAGFDATGGAAVPPSFFACSCR